VLPSGEVHRQGLDGNESCGVKAAAIKEGYLHIAAKSADILLQHKEVRFTFDRIKRAASQRLCV
jgi:hypothetical protein